MSKMPLKTTQTSSGIPVEPVYDAESVKGFDLGAQLGEPGQYPFTRGIQPTMYRGGWWRWVFDLPTQIGYDSDSPLALGEVGKVGVAIDSIEDMQRLFDGIRLDTISTSMTINATASILLALDVAVGT